MLTRRVWSWWPHPLPVRRREESWESRESCSRRRPWTPTRPPSGSRGPPGCSASCCRRFGTRDSPRRRPRVLRGGESQNESSVWNEVVINKIAFTKFSCFVVSRCNCKWRCRGANQNESFDSKFTEFLASFSFTKPWFSRSFCSSQIFTSSNLLLMMPYSQTSVAFSQTFTISLQLFWGGWVLSWISETVKNLKNL